MEQAKKEAPAEINPGIGLAEDETVMPRDEWVATLIFAAFLTLFGIFWVYASSDLPSRQQTAYLSQGFMPITAGVLLAGLSALLFINTWMTKTRPASELGVPPLFPPKEEARAAGVFLALLAYIVLLPHIHYLINTFILMALGLMLAGERIRLRLFILAAAMSLIFYLIFVWGIQLPLPGSQFA